MSIKKKLVSGLVIGSVIFSSLTPSLANEGFNAVNINNSSLSSTVNQVARFNGKKAENVYILSSEELIDGIPGGVLSGENNGAIVFLEEGKLSESSLSIVKEAKNVYAIGGQEIIPESVVSELENYKGRIYGADRYETAVKIADKLEGKRDIIITNGNALADSLAATSLAVKNDMTILLVDAKLVPEVTKDYIKENKDSNIYFVGGEGSLPQNIKEEIYNIADKNVKEIKNNTLAGSNRHETSLKISERYGSFNTLVLANGENYKDSILASSLASSLEAPVVLVDNSTVSEKVANIEGIDNLYAVSTETVSYSYMKQFIRTLLNNNQLELGIKDASGKVVYNIAQGTERTAWVTQSLNIRTGAGTSHSILGTFSKGDKVTGVEEDGWLKFDYNGKTAYVSAKYLSDSEIAKETPKETPKQESSVNGDSQDFSYSKVMTVTATAYSRNEAGLSNKTASGIDLSQTPNVIAVDRNVIPLGTKVYVEGYGYAVAGDTGGAIKGNKIDVHFDSVSRCYEWGRKTVKLYVLD